MCKFNQCLRALRKMSTKTYAMWKKLTTHCSFCVRILKTVIAVCTQYMWAWVNFVHNLHCLLKNLRGQQKFYATAGRAVCDKYHVCLSLGWNSFTGILSKFWKCGRIFGWSPDRLMASYGHADDVNAPGFWWHFRNMFAFIWSHTYCGVSPISVSWFNWHVNEF